MALQIITPFPISRAGAFVRLSFPLWGLHITQVANAEALAAIRIFSHFSLDIF
jgi:hypothetical protein